MAQIVDKLKIYQEKLADFQSKSIESDYLLDYTREIGILQTTISNYYKFLACRILSLKVLPNETLLQFAERIEALALKFKIDLNSNHPSMNILIEHILNIIPKSVSEMIGQKFEAPLELLHLLKLFPTKPDILEITCANCDKPGEFTCNSCGVSSHAERSRITAHYEQKIIDTEMVSSSVAYTAGLYTIASNIDSGDFADGGVSQVDQLSTHPKVAAENETNTNRLANVIESDFKELYSSANSSGIPRESFIEGEAMKVKQTDDFRPQKNRHHETGVGKIDNVNSDEKKAHYTSLNVHIPQAKLSDAAQSEIEQFDGTEADIPLIEDCQTELKQLNSERADTRHSEIVKNDDSTEFNQSGNVNADSMLDYYKLDERSRNIQTDDSKSESQKSMPHIDKQDELAKNIQCDDSQTELIQLDYPDDNISREKVVPTDDFEDDGNDDEISFDIPALTGSGAVQSISTSNSVDLNLDQLSEKRLEPNQSQARKSNPGNILYIPPVEIVVEVDITPATNPDKVTESHPEKEMDNDRTIMAQPMENIRPKKPQETSSGGHKTDTTSKSLTVKLMIALREAKTISDIFKVFKSLDIPPERTIADFKTKFKFMSEQFYQSALFSSLSELEADNVLRKLMSIGRSAIMKSRFSKGVKKLEAKRGVLRLDQLFSLLKDFADFISPEILGIRFKSGDLEPILHLQRLYEESMALRLSFAGQKDLGLLLQVYENLKLAYPDFVQKAKKAFDFEASTTAAFSTFESFIIKIISEFKDDERRHLKRKSETDREAKRTREEPSTREETSTKEKIMESTLDDLPLKGLKYTSLPDTPRACYHATECRLFTKGRCKYYHPDMCVHWLPIKQCKICCDHDSGELFKPVVSTNRNQRICRFGSACEDFLKGKCSDYHDNSCVHGLQSSDCPQCLSTNQKSELLENNLRNNMATKSYSDDHVRRPADCKHGKACNNFRRGKCKYFHKDGCRHSYPLSQCVDCSAEIDKSRQDSQSGIHNEFAGFLKYLSKNRDGLPIQPNTGDIVQNAYCKKKQLCPWFSRGECKYFHLEMCRHWYPSKDCTMCDVQGVSHQRQQRKENQFCPHDQKCRKFKRGICKLLHTGECSHRIPKLKCKICNPGLDPDSYGYMEKCQFYLACRDFQMGKCPFAHPNKCNHWRPRNLCNRCK